jgi:O-antigen/teichoic acid export membrane protein
MSPDAYGTWALVLQISAYVGYLDFGIQTAVGRFVAHANERNDKEHRDSIVSTSLAGLSFAGLLGLGIIAVVAILIPDIFPRLPRHLLGDARTALVLVASSLAIGLPASVFNGVFVGLQRYEIPALIIGGSRILSAVLLVIVVKHGGDLTHMGIAVASVNVLSYAMQYFLCRRLAPMVKPSARLISSRTRRELFDYCFSLSVWSFATLLVTGLDTLMVGVFDFSKVAYYTVAATLITFILGLQSSIFGVLIPEVAVLAARDKRSELGQMLIASTRLGMYILLISGLPLLIAARPLLAIWVGPMYADKSFLILRILVVANIIRLSALPYAMLLIGTGQQRLVIVSPLVEGFSNLLVSVIAAALMGAVGVAIGTLVGSIVGILVNWIYNVPRTTMIAVNLLSYLSDGILRPIACFSPLFLLLLIEWLIPGVVGNMQSRLLFVTGCLTFASVWTFGLSGNQRDRVLMALSGANR